MTLFIERVFETGPDFPYCKEILAWKIHSQNGSPHGKFDLELSNIAGWL